MEFKTIKPEVIVLFAGYSKEEGNHLFANCSCTLVKNEVNIIIDTMTSWDGDKLKQALIKNGLTCDNINYVVSTHGHSDHIGCNYLFPEAVHIVGFCISHRDKYLNHDFKSGQEYIINEFIKVIPTPGHTLQDVSVIIESNNGVVVATGDLFECEEDLNDDSIWKNAGSDSENLQIINRKRILEIADYIIPGHGPMFKLNKSN